MSLSPPVRRLSSASSGSSSKREEDLINAYEAEEERIINVLSRKLEKVRLLFKVSQGGAQSRNATSVFSSRKKRSSSRMRWRPSQSHTSTVSLASSRRCDWHSSLPQTSRTVPPPQCLAPASMATARSHPISYVCPIRWRRARKICSRPCGARTNSCGTAWWIPSASTSGYLGSTKFTGRSSSSTDGGYVFHPYVLPASLSFSWRNRFFLSGDLSVRTTSRQPDRLVSTRPLLPADSPTLVLERIVTFHVHHTPTDRS